MNIRPMLATLSREVVTGPQWVYEEKYDGIRLLAHRTRSGLSLRSRNDIDRTGDFPRIATALARLPAADFILDGEAFAYDRMRVSRFQLLHGHREPLYAIFDLLRLDSRSLLRRPLRERRVALEVLLARVERPLLVSRRLPRDGHRAYELAARRDWEGIVAKDEEAPYEPGRRSRAWLKIKVRHESEFVIGGYSAPAGSRAHFGALMVGLFDGDHLRYTGKVGTGFTGKTLRELSARLRPLRTPEPPFDAVPRFRDATWVRPELVAQLAYAEWTGDGKLRQPVYLGLREDMSARECQWKARE